MLITKILCMNEGVHNDVYQTFNYKIFKLLM